jgi:hypothetical protein
MLGLEYVHTMHTEYPLILEHTFTHTRSEFVSKLSKGVYVTTNTINTVTDKPIGECFNVIKSVKGYKILVLGFMYDFNQNSGNTNIIYMKQVRVCVCVCVCALNMSLYYTHPI